jgi:hypothetical protein
MRLTISFHLNKKMMNAKAEGFLKDLCINVENVHEIEA